MKNCSKKVIADFWSEKTLSFSSLSFYNMMVNDLEDFFAFWYRNKWRITKTKMGIYDILYDPKARLVIRLEAEQPVQVYNRNLSHLHLETEQYYQQICVRSWSPRIKQKYQW